jgi:hypothetical protein
MSRLRIAGVNARFSLQMDRWNSSGVGGFQTFSPDVVRDGQRDGAAWTAEAADDRRHHVGEFGANQDSLN